MVKYSLFFLIAFICLALVLSAPAPEDDVQEVESEVETVQPTESRKAKRGIYGGYGYGHGYRHYPYYSYSFAPYYGGYGYHGFGHGYYGHYPYYGYGYGGHYF